MKKKYLYILLSMMVINQIALPVTAHAANDPPDIYNDSESAYYNAENFCITLCKNAFRENYNQELLRMMIKTMSTGNRTGTEVAYDIIFSDDAISISEDDEDFINLCYRTLLDSVPNSAELNKWKYSLNAGMSREYVFSNIISTEKFNEMCSENGITTGFFSTNYYRDIDFETTNFINNMFIEFYGRKADIDSLEKYCHEIYEGVSYETISNEILSSEEFMNIDMDDSQFIKKAFNLFCEREPNTNELISCLELNNKEELINKMVNSREFLSKMKIRYVNVISFGDSIAAGSGVEQNENYQYIIAQYLGAEDITYGYGGYTFSNNESSLGSLIEMAEMLPKSYDYSLVLVEAGINDFSKSTILGEQGNTDDVTFNGSFNKTLGIIRKKMPNADIIVLSPTSSFYDGQINSLAITVDSYCKVMEDISKYNGVKYIDLYHNQNLNFSSDINNYTIDGLHLKNEAHEMIAHEIITELYNTGYIQ